jgi:hypothetical protein
MANKPNSLCACGQEHIVNRKRKLLYFVKDGHSVEHSVRWCAEIERWPGVKREGPFGPLPSPQLFILLAGC